MVYFSEPNSFQHVFNYTVNATQMGEDFNVLRSLLNNSERYRGSLLVGPDVTRPLPENKDSMLYLGEFLKTAGNTINAITWHQYVFH